MIFHGIGPVLPVMLTGTLSIIMRNIPLEKDFMHSLVAIIKEIACPAVKYQL